MKTYTGQLNGEERKVEELEWGWAVLNRDNTVMRQFEDDGTYHFIGEVDQANVLMFTLYEMKGDKRIDIIVPEGGRLIHKVRKISIGGPNMFQRAYIFGYKNGKQYHFNTIMPSGQIVQSIEDNVHLPDFIAPLNT